jgi:hypothetical protein
MRSAMQRMLSMNNIDDTRAKLAWNPIAPGVMRLRPMSPPPMWKLTGTPASCAVAQMGFQCGSDNAGCP